MNVPFKRANILLPKNAEMEKWAVVACDQYTSEPEYWKEVENIVGDAPSTLKITLPNKIALIKFGSSQEEYNSLLTDGYIKMNIIGRCNANE